MVFSSFGVCVKCTIVTVTFPIAVFCLFLSVYCGVIAAESKNLILWSNKNYSTCTYSTNKKSPSHLKIGEFKI